MEKVLTESNISTPGKLRVRTDVFISYSRRDKEFAIELRNFLECAGLSVWIDESSIPPGSSFLEVIYRGIEGSSTLIAILSKDFQDSRFCRLEVEHARILRKRMVPVKRGEVNVELLDPELSRFNWVSFLEERPFRDGAEECVEAITLDMQWATRGVRFLQGALDWEREGSDLLGRMALRDLAEWLNESDKERRDVSPLVRRHFQVSIAAARRSMFKRVSALIVVLAVFVGLPLHVALTTPSRAWMSTGLDSVSANGAVVTVGVGGVERIWMRRDLGEIHHPNPHEAEDDIFESKHAIYELSLDGKLTGETTYFLELYSGNRWRVGDFRFGDGGDDPRSALADELISRIQSTSVGKYQNLKDGLWSAIAPPKTEGARVISERLDLELRIPPSDSSSESKMAQYFQSEITNKRKWLVNEKYHNRITDIEVFETRPGFLLAFIQLMDSGKRYDVGVIPARSEDSGKSWVLGELIPRLAEGSGFHFNTKSIRAIAEDAKGDTWITTHYNLSAELGHPTGAPGQIARSSDGGIRWSPVKLPKSLDSYDSFTGITASLKTPGLMALSIEDRNATTDTAGPRIWLSNDYGGEWHPIEEGLNVDPLSRVRVIWVGAGPNLVALQEQQNETVRPVVYRSLKFLERLRGRVGIERR